MNNIIGLDIGGTFIKAGVIDSDANILQKYSINTNAEDGYETVLKSVVKLIKEINAKYEVDAIGIGVPGVVTDAGIVVDAPNFKNWVNIPILSDVKKNFNIPVFIDNDANTAAIAELEKGAGKNYNSFLYVTLGTGIGGAIIHNGQLFKGMNGGAGEIGHTLINAFDNSINYEKSYRSGVLEVYTGRNFILDRVKKQLYSYSDTNVDENYDVKELSEAFEKGDPLAIDVLNYTGDLLGKSIASAVNLLDLPIVVIGGGISLSKPIMNKLNQAAKLQALPSIKDNLLIKQAKFQSDTGIMGAALYAQNLLKKQRVIK